MGYDYDLVVIGGGAAGLVASKFAAGVGKRVAVIEKDRLGGECTLYGCVPSKTLTKSAWLLHQVNRADAFGLETGECAWAPKGRVFDHVRAVVDRIYEGHRPEVLERLGIKVIIGNPRFLDTHRIEISGATLSAAAFIVCTGSSPLVPPIPGLDTVPFYTNQNIFSLKEPPPSLIVLGGGPIGIELAQAFAYLGTETTLVEMGPQILPREDGELTRLLAGRLVSQGLDLRIETKAVEVARGDHGVELTTEGPGGKRDRLSGDALLVALGRRANVEGLDLEVAGIEYSQKGIKVDDRLRTAAPNIYACGDVVGPFQFSHMAEYQARIAARNALFPFKGKANYENYAWCTFTDPELAHAGLTEEEARKLLGDRIKVYRWHYRDTDRGRTEADEFGMSKFICDQSYRIVGAHILGARAGELIHEAQIVKTLGVPFYKLDSVIHVYPTLSDVVRQPAKMAHIDRLRNNFLVRTLSRFRRGQGHRRVIGS